MRDRRVSVLGGRGGWGEVKGADRKLKLVGGEALVEETLRPGEGLGKCVGKAGAHSLGGLGICVGGGG